MDCSSDQRQMITEPLLSNRKGGIRTIPFILANEAFERLASFGLSTNMIMYLTKEYGMDAAQGAQVLFLFSSATNFTPILGAVLADSYVGRYRMIGFGCVASLLGMVLLWLTTFPEARQPLCVHLSHSCNSRSTLQLVHLYTAFGFMAIGAGGIRSSSLAFGADQLSITNSLQRARIRESFFRWYYVTVTASVFVAMTCVVYIQENMGWMVGFGVPVMLMILSGLSFSLASPFYVKSKPKASWITGLAQVVVASFRNRSVELSTEATVEVRYHATGSVLAVPSKRLRFFNKACIVGNPQVDVTPDGNALDPWSLCTVDQVEDLKTLIKVIPLWSSGMLMFVNVSQGSFIVLQASTMDRHITSKFEIPAATFLSFAVLVIVLWVALYDRIIIPFVSKIKGHPVRLGLKKRMGIGILLSTTSMAALAIAESVRRETAIKEGFSDRPDAELHISTFLLLPFLALSGVAEAFTPIGQNEFFYTELPKSMSSIASTLNGIGLSVASLVSSFMVRAVRDLTKVEGQESWVSSNINKGHYDYYYWLLASLSFANFLYYLVCSKSYGPSMEEQRNIVADESY
ncbi:PREDICTED: protein NRT1/ PTR FAMILY 1.2-like [Populus euphratica]|uniref:Protein NRT1/ PTR FAMILY 1.2-like n=1 Tax=Populus euphratica TaxID=75702 RepID=A0AAJ6UCJ1_POPEU|nr:PREDICTED: protein NRT1/ PTR FAMILY 1.2-like [Populus euphratica]XP_011026627.1 PREDICTED: protein NRT1/ PTR FAMILY 1.2-like [Populus euphratica]XP_011026628.1 PREDICTED: protein NRT1/ PTR FAMILY 1.2-like [Populus euphratica]